MTASDRPHAPAGRHPARQWGRPAGRVALLRSLLAVAVGCTVVSAAAQTTEAVATGPDVVARGSIVFIPSGGPGMISCSGGVTNEGTLGVTATFSVSCPAVLGGWGCSASGGASCLSVLGPSGTAYLPPGGSVGVLAASSAQPGTHTVTVTGTAQGDVDTSNNTSIRCISVSSPQQTADLSTTVRFPRYANFGDVVDYEIDIENHGPSNIAFGAASNLRVSATGKLKAPRLASCTALTAGAQCGPNPVATHEGAYFPIGLPVGGRVTLRLSGTIPANVGLEEYVFVGTDFSCVPTVDFNSANEQGTVKTQLTLFHDEFE